MTARVIFVPGLAPKPRAEVYREQLFRVLLAALRRTRPGAAELLSAQPDAFVLVAWTHFFYGDDRDISLDLAGIDRMLTQEPTAEDLREIASWSRRADLLARIVGDTVPFLSRLANSAIRAQLSDLSRYQRDSEGIGTRIRGLVREALESAWADRARVLLIGHSLGSVICYDTLWDLSRERGANPRVELFVTLGSPLATNVIRRGLRGTNLSGGDAYPHNIVRWVNFSARADTTALQPRLEPRFRQMLELGLVDSIEDYGGLANCFRGANGLNTHDAYGYLYQRKLAEIVGDFVEQG